MVCHGISFFKRTDSSQKGSTAGRDYLMTGSEVIYIFHVIDVSLWDMWCSRCYPGVGLGGVKPVKLLKRVLLGDVSERETLVVELQYWYKHPDFFWTLISLAFVCFFRKRGIEMVQVSVLNLLSEPPAPAGQWSQLIGGE